GHADHGDVRDRAAHRRLPWAARTARAGLTRATGAAGHCPAAGTTAQPASSPRVSTTRWEKPHSLSYQATTFTCRPSARVSSESNTADAGFPVMSLETSGASLYSSTPAIGPSAAAR